MRARRAMQAEDVEDDDDASENEVEVADEDKQAQPEYLILDGHQWAEAHPKLSCSQKLASGIMKFNMPTTLWSFWHCTNIIHMELIWPIHPQEGRGLSNKDNNLVYSHKDNNTV
ncbi:hypothetical protein ACJX0J_009021, partial [Zea mays]